MISLIKKWLQAVAALQGKLRARRGAALVLKRPAQNNRSGDSVVGQRGATRVKQRGPAGKFCTLKDGHHRSRWQGGQAWKRWRGRRAAVAGLIEQTELRTAIVQQKSA